jgi:hypothetical protein
VNRNEGYIKDKKIERKPAHERTPPPGNKRMVAIRKEHQRTRGR